MVYADYSYYKDVYGGTMPEAEFRRQVRLASAYLDQITMGRISALAGDDRARDACCAVAEEYRQQEQGTVASETNGDHSITFSRGASEKSGGARLYEAAALYLATTGLLYRGMGCRRC